MRLGRHSSDATSRVPRLGCHVSGAMLRVPRLGCHVSGATPRVPHLGCHTSDATSGVHSQTTSRCPRTASTRSPAPAREVSRLASSPPVRLTRPFLLLLPWFSVCENLYGLPEHRLSPRPRFQACPQHLGPEVSLRLLTGLGALLQREGVRLSAALWGSLQDDQTQPRGRGKASPEPRTGCEEQVGDKQLPLQWRSCFGLSPPQGKAF